MAISTELFNLNMQEQKHAHNNSQKTNEKHEAMVITRVQDG